MLHSVTIGSLFSKPVRITEGHTIKKYDQELEIQIGETLPIVVKLQWDDDVGEYFIQYKNGFGQLKREMLGIDTP